jgi:hydroxymethylglutaryl-CoA synthase
MIGIDAMACSVPQHYVDLVELAEARGVDPGKFTKGLGQRKMAIATPPEDAVHLAANAARKALDRFTLDPQEIGMLAVGTETAVDHSKPISVYLHEALKLRQNSSVFEVKHACFGATAAMSSAIDWIASGRAKGSKALIVATDVARYGVNTAGEPTQGAGAVAMVISEQPRLLAFDPGVIGEYADNVMDFWRPLYRKEAVTDGHYSITCYLDALRGALTDAGPDLPALSDLGAALYHVPFGRMALKAHHTHVEFETGSKIEKGGAEWPQVLDSHQAKTAPWLALNEEVGNIYTGSLYLAALDVLRVGALAEGAAVSLFSYGSGSVASVRLARTVAGYAGHRSLLDPTAELESRTRLSVSEYEAVMADGDQALEDDVELSPQNWNLNEAPFLYLGNEGHIRRYAGLTR